MGKNGQYFGCIFHNGFRFDMTFLTKSLWLSLWQTKDVTLLGCGLTTLKAHNIGRHVKFIDSTKYYQQPLSKLARSTDPNEKKKIKSLFIDNLGYLHPYYSKFFLQLDEEEIIFVLDCWFQVSFCDPWESKFLADRKFLFKAERWEYLAKGMGEMQKTLQNIENEKS